MAETAAPVTRQRPARKKKKNQIPIGIGVFALMIVIGALLSLLGNGQAMFWTFGGCFGFVLQKARFCFTASLRDPCITGSTSVTKAVLIAFAITCFCARLPYFRRMSN